MLRLVLIMVMSYFSYLSAAQNQFEIGEKEIDRLLKEADKVNKLSDPFKTDSLSGTLQRAISRITSGKIKARMLNRIAQFKMFQSEYDSAWYFNEQLRKVLDETEPTYTRGEFLYYAISGGILKNWGRFDESLQAWDQAIDLAHSPQERTNALINIAMVYGSMNDVEAAKKHYELSHEINTSLGHPMYVAHTAYSIGNCWKKLGEYDSAFKWFAKAEELKMRHDTEFNLYCAKTNIYLTQKKYIEAAVSLSTIAPKTIKRASKKEMQAKFWQLCGQILNTEGSGILRQHVGDIMAENALEKSVQIAEEAGGLNLLMSIYMKVGTELLKMGKEARGNELIAKSEDLRNKTYNRALVKGYKKESELAKGRADKRLSQQQVLNKKQKELLIVLGSGVLVLSTVTFFLFRLNRQQKQQNETLSQEKNQIKRANHILLKQTRVLGKRSEEDFQRQWIDEVKSAILENLHETNPTHLAQKLNTSKRTLHRKLKENGGTTPERLILETKLHKAEELFTKKPRKNISEVAYECGFSDAAHFSRTFKSYFGSTPSQFIQDLKKLAVYQ